MSKFAHIFIGKEFTDVISGVGRATLKYCGSTTASDINYILVDYGSDALTLSRLDIKSTTGDEQLAQFDYYIDHQLTTLKSVSTDEFAAAWGEVFDTMIDARTEDQVLTIMLHAPLYKPEAFEVLKVLYAGIKVSNKPTRINCVGYSDDMVKIIEPGFKIESASKKQVASFIKLRASYNATTSDHLIMLQNTTTTGTTLRLDINALPEIISQFALACHSNYTTLFSPTMEYKDVVGFGISTLQVDKFMLVEYLMQRMMLHDMDAASVNNTSVDVNKAIAVCHQILKYKDQVLSEFFKNKEELDTVEVQQRFAKEADSIIATCTELFEKEKDITVRTAILAVMLSKTDCALLSQSVYDPESICVYDLFSECIDYFITNDYGKYFEYEGQSPINPIPELKQINAKVINAEADIRRLSAQAEEVSVQLAENRKAEQCYIEDGVFHFGEHDFRLMPNLVEEPLEETYEPPKNITLPESVDLRGNFTRIKNQGNQGSCLAHALTSIFEYAVKLNTSKAIDLSEAFLYYNARKMDTTGDVDTSTDIGSRVKPAIASLMEYGIATEEVCPYNDADYTTPPSDEAYADAKTRRLIKALNVNRSSVDIKKALAEGYPVEAHFILCPTFTDASIGGYVAMPTETEIEEALSLDDSQKPRHHNHAMVIVGYSDKLNCFVVRNSWGDDWGDNGYCYIPYIYVDDKRLFINACIITEIESMKAVKMASIPTITVDDQDLRIKYCVCCSLLDAAKYELQQLKVKRTSLLEYFERLTKTLASMPNQRDAYIQSSKEVLEKEKSDLLDANKGLANKIEENKGALHKYNIGVMYTFAGILAAAFGGYYACTILMPIWPLIIAVITVLVLGGLSYRKIFSYSSYVVATAATFGIYALADWIFAGGSQHLSILWTLVVLVPMLCLLGWKAHNEWQNYREINDQLLCDIEKNKTRIKQIEAIVAKFKYKTFAAWYLLREMDRVQTKLYKWYGNYLSLINNLRTWYEEAKLSVEQLSLDKSLPNTSLLNAELLDRLFEEHLKNDPKCEIDFCTDIDSYTITEESIGKYKRSLVDKVAKILLTHPAIAGFDITEHAMGRDVATWVKPIDQKCASECARLADFFIHLSRVARPSLQRSEYVLAPRACENGIGYSEKFCRALTTLDSVDNYILTYITIATLECNDCEILRS